MKKDKFLLTAFAVFASILMLMTPTTAGPVKEKITIDSIEQQTEITDSLESFVTKIENDREIARLSLELKNDRELRYIASMVERINDPNQKISTAMTYIEAMKNKDAYKKLQEYIDSQYSKDIATICAQVNNLMLLVQENYEQQKIKYNTLTNLNDEIQTSSSTNKYLGLTTVFDENNQYGYISNKEIEQNNDFIIYTSNDLEQIGKIDYLMKNGDMECLGIAGPEEMIWAGFFRNLDGDIYVPGFGWVSPDDPNYDDILNLEDYLQNSGLSIGEIQDILDQVSNAEPSCILSLIYGILQVLWYFVNEGILSGIIALIGFINTLLDELGPILNLIKFIRKMIKIFNIIDGIIG